MSKQRNKRNTRRGRAKRWRCVDGAMVMSGAGAAVVVERCVTAWYVEVWSLGANFIGMARIGSRAAAMRAAEHLARGR